MICQCFLFIFFRLIVTTTRYNQHFNDEVNVKESTRKMFLESEDSCVYLSPCQKNNLEQSIKETVDCRARNRFALRNKKHESKGRGRINKNRKTPRWSLRRLYSLFPGAESVKTSYVLRCHLIYSLYSIPPGKFFNTDENSLTPYSTHLQYLQNLKHYITCKLKILDETGWLKKKFLELCILLEQAIIQSLPPKHRLMCIENLEILNNNVINFENFYTNVYAYFIFFLKRDKKYSAGLIDSYLNQLKKSLGVLNDKECAPFYSTTKEIASIFRQVGEMQ